jgi:hypothetical protein
MILLTARGKENTGALIKEINMSVDIVSRLRKMLSWDNAEEAVQEIEILRKMVRDWEQTAKMLAMDLGDIEFADEIYEDVQSGLYDKVRERLYPNG